MNRQKFYNTFNSRDTAFKQVGFSKRKDGHYLYKGRINLKIVLNKWRWSEEYGWSFLLRMSDKACETEVDGVTNNLYSWDILFADIIQEAKTSEKDLYGKAYYKQYKHQPYDRGDKWILFFDEKNLEQLLETLMPTIAQLTSKRAEAQIAKQKPCLDKTRLTVEQETKMRKEFYELFED